MKNTKIVPPGALNEKYALSRKTKKSLQYRLKRRTHEIVQAIYKYHPSKIDTILDIGTAEGKMLSSIKKEFPQTECIGLEYSQELIKMNENKDIKIIQGDAQDLPFKNNSFHVILATAVIEHLSQPSKLLSESYRVLKRDGIFILTTADPFFDRIAEILSTEEKEYEERKHQETFNIKILKKNFRENNFQILCAEKFMMSPIGFPIELKIEKIIKFLKLDFILLNQLMVGKK